MSGSEASGAVYTISARNVPYATTPRVRPVRGGAAVLGTPPLNTSGTGGTDRPATA